MKPVWTCIHRDGDKFYHYGYGDWINAQNGEKVAPDLTAIEQKSAALFIGDATHLWIADDIVQLLKLDYLRAKWSIHTEGIWVELSKKPEGQIVLLAAQERDEWVSFKGDNPPAFGSIVDVEWFDGDTDFGRPSNGYRWNPCNNIKRWRYA